MVFTLFSKAQLMKHRIYCVFEGSAKQCLLFPFFSKARPCKRAHRTLSDFTDEIGDANESPII